MTETADDLSAPLGQDKPRRKRRLRLPFSAMQLLAVLLGLFLLTFAGFAIFNKDPLGGEPMTRIAIRENGADKAPAEKPAAPADSKHETREAPKQAAPGEQKTVTMIDGSTGARHDVVIGAGDAADKGEAAAASAPPPVMAGIDPKLLEKSRYGMIPVVAGDLKPFNVYAADADRTKAAKMPVVAIVIGGLGVGAAKTLDAIMKLPPAVTLAFTPYGADPGKLAERARAQRHEIFLQIPMEPYDFPDNDPGPQTLLTSLSPDQNMDRLYWHLSRMQGYAGITNFMGARFVATEPAMQPIIREAAKRGLGFFDDGSSPRSIASQAASSAAMPFGKGDIAIDAVPTPTEIDRALNKLESAARERGAAVGTASALPVSIDRIGAWTKTLGDRGILLVPLTTAMLKSKSS
ncbi:divergent polysaccharide deacetylase family protein [uncultured Bradyrhizobium sp.]|jgi:polysaccharide deacetylase 2 family uncharacterized protein YibQ|uniref:divergent polysaccharide deacetylase family protein n=1 Tax=uncultured Bradyrhizobium sp. TaxID=199684 RepID=UPI002608A511|nr:divergent polysaccharide deacetylase family protein [uncultured Bradyrhizobium sp.]